MTLPLEFDSIAIADLQKSLRLEWLETNGLGGYCCGSISGAHARRYHGLLVSAVKPPAERMVMVSKIDEALLLADKRVELSTNIYPGTVHPKGYQHISSFERGLFPQWTFAVGNTLLRKTVAAIHGSDLVVVRYELLKATTALTLQLKPLIACRDHHALTRANNSINHDAGFRNDVLVLKPYVGVPGIHIQATGASYIHHPEWYFNFIYEIERDRGFECTEDLFTYGTLEFRLKEGESAEVILSTAHSGGLDGKKLLSTETTRRKALLKPLVKRNDLIETLTLAADQFIVQRGSGKTVIAGYPWFTDWGRDTMISLPGLCLSTGRFDDAKFILAEFAKAVDQGMIPNRFPDQGSAPEYNTVDGTLWFFVAAHLYAEATDDKAFIKERILPALLEILDWHQRGTRYGIKVDEDGLLTAGDANTQLTWMDARVHGNPVTPRFGKAVEINALWYNALEITAALGAPKAKAAELKKSAAAVKKRFEEVFWSKELECLIDCVSPGEVNTQIRPNQIFALSLPFPLLTQAKARKVLAVVERELATPFGLRSLSPQDSEYCPRYQGDPESRDRAYHQGTVWSFFIGPYAIALLRFCGEIGQAKAEEVVRLALPHLSQAGIGTVSEVFDGDSPYTPGGCFAQAWGVAELLRAALESLQSKKT